MPRLHPNSSVPPIPTTCYLYPLGSRRQYDDLKATEVYCPSCRAAMPVRESLLLVLPDSELFQITCARCGEELARQTRKDGEGPVAIHPGLLRRPR